MKNKNIFSSAGGTQGFDVFISISVIILLSIFIAYTAGAQTIRIVQDSADYSTSTIYPKDSPGMPTDWRWDNFTFSVYIVPDSLTQLYGIKCQFQWDPAKISVVSVSKGNMWDPEFFYAVQGVGSYTINAAKHGVTNYVVRRGDYIAKMILRVQKPCITTLSLPVVEIRDVNNQHLSFTASPATAHFFLGDFVAYAFPVIDQTHGDGQVNFGDLSYFGSAYFSTNSDPIYRVKYDIGPTANGNVTSLPLVDGVINFPDLVIFSLMYGRTSLPKENTSSPEPYVVVKQDRSPLSKQMDITGFRDVSIPLNVKSRLNDMHAMEFSIPGNYADAKEISVTLSDAIHAYNGQVFVAVHAQKDMTIVDLAMMNTGLDVAGEIGTINLKGVKTEMIPEANIVRARNGMNQDILNSSSLEKELPTVLKLYPNYPNPFNPTTTLQYVRPDAGTTTVRIVSMLGEEVFTNVRIGESEGTHTIVWDGHDNRGQALPSGIYMIRVETATASAVTKITLLK